MALLEYLVAAHSLILSLYCSCFCSVDRDDQTKILKQVHHQPVDDELQRVKDQHKTSMKNKYESLFEPVKLQDNQTLLNRIYTQLYIIEGESEWVNEEHEVLHVEKTPRTLHSLQSTVMISLNPQLNQDVRRKTK